MQGGIIILWISFLITGFIMMFIPYMTRKTENFGVSIPEDVYGRNDFRKMRKQYSLLLLSLICLLVIMLGILAFFLPLTKQVILISIAIAVYLVISFLLYLPFHFKMKQIKQMENWQQQGTQTITIDTSFRKGKLTYSYWWFLVPGILTIATIAFTFYFYDVIPDKIPMHTDFEGNVRYDPKSIGSLLFMPVMQLFMLGTFLIINIVIKHSKQQVSAANPERSKQQNILFRRVWSLFTILSGILMVLLFGFIQGTFIYPALDTYTDTVIFSVIAIMLLGSIVLSIYTGQGGSRIKIEGKKDTERIDRDDDHFWKLGQFYVNKNDPSIFIEKRFGIGWTNNWAHPLSWFFIIGIILIPLILVWILI